MKEIGGIICMVSVSPVVHDFLGLDQFARIPNVVFARNRARRNFMGNT
jgi:hypothetical protein